jgi:hypothetical protein
VQQELAILVMQVTIQKETLNPECFKLQSQSPFLTLPPSAQHLRASAVTVGAEGEQVVQ